MGCILHWIITTHKIVVVVVVAVGFVVSLFIRNTLAANNQGAFGKFVDRRKKTLSCEGSKYVPFLPVCFIQ